jgi:starch synthase (maltosyl-transferring)
MEQLRGMLAVAEQLGMAVMDLVINHVAIDSPLIQGHPKWVRRDPGGELVHPRAKDEEREEVWGDLAQADNAASPDREALWAYWRGLALHYAALGVRGFRCDAAYQVPAALWQYLSGEVKAKDPGVVFFAETLGCTPQPTLATASAGFDFIFNSSKWWDFAEPWCLEQYALLAPLVASISFPASHDTPRLAEALGGDRAAILQRYTFAASVSTGVMMPVGFECGFRRRLHVVETTPAHWEAPHWDGTSAIAAVNRTKAAHPPLNDEGPLALLPVGNPHVLAFRKWTRGWRACVAVCLNLDREAAHSVPIPSDVQTGSLVVTELATASRRLVGADGHSTIPPLGAAVVRRADRHGPPTAAAPIPLGWGQEEPHGTAPEHLGGG